ncbi:PREDICTED: uncharacterized protein LOC108662022 [Theobroma cacao]|uniref:Uncharacterized protein LOC108662022 n=1 Tax=Theobroma cacao TaxID=3641 RepID=A0AB32WCU3_THECC|nr:PREDICTED: uncharacterized protein LOC108662022 [Theobroma cacao]
MHNSSHDKCLKAYEDLMKQKQHIDIMVVGISSQAKLDDRVGLNASIECVRVSLKNAPENHKLNAPSIQKDICNTAAFLTTRAMIEDIGDDFFSLLVDEARDSAILEVAVDSLFATHGLSTSHIHGQGYNGANNMSGNLQELNEHFDNVNTELLSCIACLDPRHSFSGFDEQKLIQLVKFYPLEFDDVHLLALDDQLDIC